MLPYSEKKLEPFTIPDDPPCFFCGEFHQVEPRCKAAEEEEASMTTKFYKIIRDPVGQYFVVSADGTYSKCWRSDFHSAKLDQTEKTAAMELKREQVAAKSER